MFKSVQTLLISYVRLTEPEKIINGCFKSASFPWLVVQELEHSSKQIARLIFLVEYPHGSNSHDSFSRALI
jgi:hypothetical protein